MRRWLESFAAREEAIALATREFAAREKVLGREFAAREEAIALATREFAAREEAIRESLGRQERRRKKLEETIERNNHCQRKGCTGSLEIKDKTYQGRVTSSSLVCNKCNYERFESPEYASCYLADDFLEAAEKLEGKSALPASFNVYWACELYLRELGGSYYYKNDDDDEPDFVSPSDKHGLVRLRGRLEKSRRETSGCQAGRWRELQGIAI